MIIRKIVNGNMASAIMKEVHLRGYSPEEFILFVAGGAGPTHAEGFKGDIPKTGAGTLLWLLPSKFLRIIAER